MNWLDVIITICVAISVFWGIRNGLLGTSLFFLGMLIGWFIAGRVSEMVGDSLKLSKSMDASITVLTYLLIISISIVLTRSAIRLIKPVSTVVDIATLGINRLAGVAIGLLTGIIIGAVIVIVMARFSYEFDLHDSVSGMAPGPTALIINSGSVVASLENTKNVTDKALTKSTIAGAYVKLFTTLPGNSLGFLPGDFMAALEIMDSRR